MLRFALSKTLPPKNFRLLTQRFLTQNPLPLSERNLKIRTQSALELLQENPSAPVTLNLLIESFRKNPILNSYTLIKPLREENHQWCLSGNDPFQFEKSLIERLKAQNENLASMDKETGETLLTAIFYLLSRDSQDASLELLQYLLSELSLDPTVVNRRGESFFSLLLVSNLSAISFRSPFHSPADISPQLKKSLLELIKENHIHIYQPSEDNYKLLSFLLSEYIIKNDDETRQKNYVGLFNTLMIGFCLGMLFVDWTLSPSEKKNDYTLSNTR